MISAMLAGSLALAAGPAMAGFYHCTLKPPREGTILPEDMQIGTLSNGAHVVSESYVNYLAGGPMPVDISRESPKIIVYAWKTPGHKNESGQYTSGFQYRVSIQKATGAANVYMKAIGYNNSWNVAGSCKKIKPPV